ncbi:uncharacterized protein LOC121376092 isoform X2 [Gigantopelta aegis]|uniref:uncharacterized protein LOC121376092 isoform X2 n=1 Tax=Gigantopelta aegis TaxID=1735272 RepID=UPI001B88ADC4|nr:uncharacterized protein LOC121376092 isoform X2 [Gigantopelta aegis]
MPTSSQSLILLKTDNGNFIHFYKYRIPGENIPLEISKVDVTGNLPPYSTRVDQPCSLTPVKRKEPLPSLYNRSQTEDLVNRHTHTVSGSDDIPLIEDVLIRKIDGRSQSVKADNFWNLLDLGFSVSSFKGLQSMAPLRADLSSENPIIPKAPRSRTNSGIKQASSAPVRPTSEKFPVSDYKSAPKLDRPRKKSASKRSSAELPRTTDELESKGNEDLKPEVKKLERKKSLKLPTIRMRRILPPPTPGALCFTLKGVNASHEDVKDVIESQLGCVLDTLLFDPVYIHMGETDREHKTMWVFTVKGENLNVEGLHQGIRWNGERSRLRYLDDVMRDEYNAYRLFKSIQDEKSSKGLGALRKRLTNP